MSIPDQRRAQIARLVLTRCGLEPTEERVAALAEDAGRVADTLPPLTAEQRDKIAVLLRPAPHRGGGAA